MLRGVDSDRIVFPRPDGTFYSGRNLQEDNTFGYSIPPQLLESQRIHDVLAVVSNKYLFYLLFGAPFHSESVMHKICHTNDVVRIMIEVYEENAEFSLEDAVCLALAHDIARAVQGGFFNKHSDYYTRTNHGEIGAEIYKTAFPDDAKVYEGILYHNAFNPAVRNYWISLIQDVDRLAIYRRIFDKTGAESYKDFRGNTISFAVLADFAQGRSVHKSKVQSEADDWICTLSWIWSFTVQKARVYLANQRYPEQIVQYVSQQFEPTALQMKILQKTLDRWHAVHRV